MPAARRRTSASSVSSSFAVATISPVSGSTMSLASTRPSRKSSGTGIFFSPAASRSRRFFAVIRFSLLTITLPDLSAMSKRAISPFMRSATKSICAPLLASLPSRWNVSNTKKCSRICSDVMPIAFSRIVTGILRRRSTRKNRMSFGSNSKSSHEPRYGMIRAENSSLPDECVLPRSCLEEHARRAVQLRNDDAFRAVDDERAGRRHERHFRPCRPPAP